ncbi:HAMP domain-containing protein [Lachnospiraceae bacterium RM5]|nr:HAMP domain-containing protein [Lachnospiraceae bacterium RM5]
MKSKMRRFNIYGIVLILLGLILIVSRRFVYTYDVGDEKYAYPSWVVYMDISDDKNYFALNDNNEYIYILDHKNGDKIISIIDYNAYDENNISPYEVSFDGKDLMVYCVESDSESDEIKSEYVYRFSTDGRKKGKFKTVSEEDEKGKKYKTSFGMAVNGEIVEYIEEYGNEYAIISLDKKSGDRKELARFDLYENERIINAEYDEDGFQVVFNDGNIRRVTNTGNEELINRFNFEINDKSDGNIYADLFVKVNDTYYFLDKKFFDAIYSYKDGVAKKEYSLVNLGEIDSDIDENTYAYYEAVVDNAISSVQSHKDILMFSSNANIYIVENGEISNIFATDEGLVLPGKYSIPLMYVKYSLIAGYVLIGLGALCIILYFTFYKFRMVYKIIFFIIPVVILSFIIISNAVAKKATKIYFDDLNEKMVAISSLVAQNIDTDIIDDINNLDDINNGNYAKLKKNFDEAVNANAGSIENITFELSLYNPDGLHYLAVDYPGTEELFLNTYFLKNPETMYESRIGETNTYSFTSFSQADYYIDAITVIYDEDEVPVALLDVYGYQTQINEAESKIKESIIKIAGISCGIITLILTLIAIYITGSLSKTSHVVEKISKGDLSARVKRIHKDEVGIVGEGINDMAAKLEIAFKNKEEFSKQVIETLVGTVDAKDKYTNGHSLRVAKYSREIAKRLGKSKSEQRDIYYAGLLHDIGKIGVPDEIINKTSRLTDDEYDVIKKHPGIGYDLLKNLSQLENIGVGAYGHHERYDGKGYPRGLKGEENPEIARIISVADAYDAMTSNRSYRKAMERDEVRAEIKKGKGTQFDPEFAEIMLEVDEDIKDEVYV